MIEAAKITMILIFEKKIKLLVPTIAIKEEAKNVMFGSKRDASKAKNSLVQWVLQNT